MSNKVIILCDKLQKEIDIKISDAWNIDSYIEYTYGNNGECIAYTKYIIKERIMDIRNNLILVCEEQYNND